MITSYFFYTRKGSNKLILRINLGESNTNKRIATNIVVDKLHFNQEEQRFVGIDLAHRNAQARLIEIANLMDGYINVPDIDLKRIKEDIQQKPKLDIPEDKITLSSALDDLYRNKSKHCKKSSLRTYQNTLNSLYEVIGKVGDLNLESVNLYAADGQQDRAKRIAAANSYFSKFNDYMITEKQWSINYQNNIITVLKEALKLVNKLKGVDVSCNLGLTKKENIVIAMYPEETEEYLRSNLHFLDKDDHLSFLLTKIQILSGMRVDDILNLTEEDFRPHPDNDNLYLFSRLSTKRSKFGICSVPASWYQKVKELGFQPSYVHDKANSSAYIRLYNYRAKRFLSLFPFCQREVDYIEQTPENKRVRVKKKLLEIWTSHNLIKSGLSYYAANGFSFDQIATISGKSMKIVQSHYVRSHRSSQALDRIVENFL